MRNISFMSRAELVRELIALPHPPIVSDAPASDQASCESAPCLPQHASTDQLVSHKLAVAREMLLRDLLVRMQSGPVLASPEVVREWLALYCAKLEREVFIVLHLDVRRRLIEAEELFRGTLTETSIYPREVVKSVLARNSASLILAHNHPSGYLEPSPGDRVITAHLKSALALIDVRIDDHFIVSGASMLSFSEQGLL